MDQILDKSVRAATTERRHYKLNFPQNDVFAAIGSLCVAEITQRGNTPDKKVIAEYARMVAKWLTDQETKPSLILSGNSGTGKTTIARAVCWYLHHLEIYDKCFIAATDLNENFIINPGDSARKFCDGSGCTWLFLDDVGEEQTDVREYGNIKSPFIKVVSSRYGRMLPMMITTNLDAAEIEKKYGVRTMDRLREMAEWIPFNGSSFRR